MQQFSRPGDDGARSTTISHESRSRAQRTGIVVGRFATHYHNLCKVFGSPCARIEG